MPGEVYVRRDAAALQLDDGSMKVPWFIAGLLVTGTVMLPVRAHAGSLGRGFRGIASPALTRHGIGFPNRGRFFARHRRYRYVSVLGAGGFVFPGLYAGDDGYLYDYPGADYAAVDAGPDPSAVPVQVQLAPVQGGYGPQPVYVVVNTGQPAPASSTAAGPGIAGNSRSNGSSAQQANGFQEPIAPALPSSDRPTPASAPMPSRSPGTPAGVFDNLALVSWFKEDGKDTVLVENTMTKDVQEITSEPNKDNLRLVGVRPNINPNLSEVVIADGTDQRAIRFRSEAGH